MGGDGGSLSITLTIISVISLLTLFSKIFYALWHRPQTDAGACAEHRSSCSSPDSDDRSLHRQLDMEIFDIDLLKLQGLFGPPRFLFTIKEEEREEGLESPADKSLHSEENVAKKIICYDMHSMLSLKECFEADDATPTEFLTPAPSPV